MRKFAILFVLTMLIAVGLNAQKPARYSLYQFNGLSLNPAYAGSYEGTSYTGFFRQQWAAIEGAPQNIILCFNSRSQKWDNVGIGFYIENDQLGLTNLFNGMAIFSYSFRTDNGTLAAGLQGGVQYFNSDLSGTKAVVGDPGQYDPSLLPTSLMQPNFGGGLYYYADDSWYVGASVPYLIEKGNFYLGQDSVSIVNQTLQINATAGYVLELSDGLDLKPTLLMKILPNDEIDPLQFDLSANVFIKKTFWVGATVRFNSSAKPESTVLMLASDFTNGLRLGYAFDYSFGTAFANIYTSSHEVMVGYDISRSTKRGHSPRYF